MKMVRDGEGAPTLILQELIPIRAPSSGRASRRIGWAGSNSFPQRIRGLKKPERSMSKKASRNNLAILFRKAIRNGARLTVTAKEGPFDFSESELNKYAAIGKYVSEIARLEYDIDDFILKFSVKFPDLSRSITRSTPFKIDEKAAYVVYAHALYPKLRECGDIDGSLSLNYIYYGIIELFDKRNTVVHGTIISSEHKDDAFRLSVRKFKRVGKRDFKIEETRYGSGFLEQSLKEAHYLSTFIWRAKRVLEGTDVAKERDELLRGRAKVRYLQQRFPELFQDD
jgi:hypothetical protein